MEGHESKVEEGEDGTARIVCSCGFVGAFRPKECIKDDTGYHYYDLAVLESK